MNMGSEIRAFHDLHTYVNYLRNLTGRSDSISMISSLGRSMFDIGFWLEYCYAWAFIGA